jgi:aminoglycoside phosphotransferase (APT) family kinase protein
MLPTNHSDIAADFASHLGADVPAALTSWRLASQGMSDETIFATVTCPEAHELVIRRFRPDGIAQELKEIGRQFKLLDALRGKGIPIADVLWHEPTSSLFGAPFFVMRRVAGHVPVPWSPEGRTFLREAGDGATGQQFVDILARIHALPWRGLGVDFLPGASEIPHFAAREIERLAASVRRYRTEPEPVFEDALGWLAAHAPKVEDATLVHGDYRTGNMIYDEGRIAAVLDWEMAAVGDPMLDLAWVCARSNRMESDRVCYLLPREVFLERYEKASGRMRDEPRIRFWELFHQVRNGMAWISAADAWKTGRTKDLRLARWSMTLPTMRRLILELLEEVA